MRSIFIIAGTALLLGACNTSQQEAAKQAAKETKDAASTLVNTVASGGVPGIYLGVTPCADCAGIETRLYLYADSSFVQNDLYLGKANAAPFTSTGKWSRENSLITLTDGNTPRKLRLGLNKLTILDLEGKEIESSFKQRYILSKIGDF